MKIQMMSQNTTAIETCEAIASHGGLAREFRLFFCSVGTLHVMPVYPSESSPSLGCLIPHQWTQKAEAQVSYLRS